MADPATTLTGLSNVKRAALDWEGLLVSLPDESPSFTFELGEVSEEALSEAMSHIRIITVRTEAKSFDVSFAIRANGSIWLPTWDEISVRDGEHLREVTLTYRDKFPSRQSKLP